MDECLKNICVNEEMEDTLVYADDAAVITREAASLQNALERWNTEMEEMGMKLNKQKTEVIVVARDRETIDIRIQGEEIRQVRSFEYLGVTLEEQGQMEREMTRRIFKFTRNVGMLYPI